MELIRLLQFNAVQAVQKTTSEGKNTGMKFNAVQAVQKDRNDEISHADMFNAVQAVQKRYCKSDQRP